MGLEQCSSESISRCSFSSCYRALYSHSASLRCVWPHPLKYSFVLFLAHRCENAGKMIVDSPFVDNCLLIYGSGCAKINFGTFFASYCCSAVNIANIAAEILFCISLYLSLRMRVTQFYGTKICAILRNDLFVVA